jgi:hypothetical protein
MNQQQEKMIQGLQELGKVPAERRQQLLVGAGAEEGQLQLSTPWTANSLVTRM